MSLIDQWRAEEEAVSRFEEQITPQEISLRLRRAEVIELVLRNHGIQDEHVCGPAATQMTVRQLAWNIARRFDRGSSDYADIKL